jgi:hypothetical protein
MKAQIAVGLQVVAAGINSRFGVTWVSLAGTRRVL